MTERKERDRILTLEIKLDGHVIVMQRNDIPESECPDPSTLTCLAAELARLTATQLIVSGPKDEFYENDELFKAAERALNMELDPKRAHEL